MFSRKFEHKVRNLAAHTLEEGSNEVLVYRIFEVNETATWPETKEDLKLLISNKQAMEFHSKFSKGHKMPNFDAWLNHVEETDVEDTEIQFYQK